MNSFGFGAPWSLLLLPLSQARVGSEVNVCTFLQIAIAIAPAGEISPQAAGKSYGLAIGAYASPIVRLLIIVVYVIAKPISMVLDWALGEDHSVSCAHPPLSIISRSCCHCFLPVAFLRDCS